MSDPNGKLCVNLLYGPVYPISNASGKVITKSEKAYYPFVRFPPIE